MKRSGPPKRKTPLKANKSLQGGEGLKRSELKKRSTKRQEVMQNDRIPLIKQLVEAGFGCEIGPALGHYGIPGSENCTGKIQGLHERRKRSSGGSLTNRDNLIPACNWCNGLIEDRCDVIRRSTGDSLIVREGDPEWERLGSRRDRCGEDVQEPTDG